MKLSQWIGLERQKFTLLVEQFKLVLRTLFDTGNKNFPQSVARMQTHDMATAVPIIETTDHADA